MIELTKEEALGVLLTLSRIEGYLFSIKQSNEILECAEYSINMLVDKLKVDKTDDVTVMNPHHILDMIGNGGGD